MSNPEPAWYRNPEDPSSERWWDGTQWTEHVRSAAPMVAPQPQPQRPAPTTVASYGAQPAAELLVDGSAPFPNARENGWASAAIWCAIGSMVVNLLLVPGILAIIFGGLGVAKANRESTSGRGPSIAAIIIGAVATALSIKFIGDAGLWWLNR